jgi:hypothetical protein
MPDISGWDAAQVRRAVGASQASGMGDPDPETLFCVVALRDVSVSSQKHIGPAAATLTASNFERVPMQRHDLPPQSAPSEKRAWSRPTVTDEDIRNTETTAKAGGAETPTTDGPLS